MARRWILALCLGSQSLAFASDWLQLQDGSIVELLKRDGDRAKVRQADGNERSIDWAQVDGVLKEAQAEREVLTALQRLRTEPKAHLKTGERLAKIGSAAIPTLEAAWKRAKTPYEQALVMACLQYVWSARALPILTTGLAADDPQLRDLAKRVLDRQVPTRDRAEIYASLQDSADPNLAGPSLRQRLLADPDPDILRKSLASVTLRAHVHSLLPRCHALAYEDMALELLSKGIAEERASALLGLIAQWNGSAKVREIMRAQLTAETAMARDLAGEYFRRLGTMDDWNSVQAQFLLETDAHAKASFAAAIAAIKHREKTLTETAERAITFQAGTPKALERAREWYREYPSQEARQQLIDLAREAVPVAPYFTVMGDQDLTRTLESSRPAFPWSRRIAIAYGQLLTDLTGVPTAERPSELPIARRLIVPVRGYVDPKRKSFGRWIDPERFAGSPFANSFHVGDDVAWNEQGASVVSIGDGVVRVARPASGGSWGGIVVIEHQSPSGKRFCSVYGHLGLVLNTRMGQRVGKGQKIGTVGRDWTHDNGGFVSHVHFGIHRGRYSSRVTSGYLSKPAFEDPNRGWTDPQVFIRRYNVSKHK